MLFKTSEKEIVKLTFLQSSHTTDLTPGDPSCSPHSRQRDIPSPHTVFFMSSRRFIKRLQQYRGGGRDATLNATANHPAATSVRWCQKKTAADFINLSPDPLLLHCLHFLRPGNHAVYYLFLFICQVWTRTRAWLHGPGTPVGQTIVVTLFTWS